MERESPDGGMGLLPLLNGVVRRRAWIIWSVMGVSLLSVIAAVRRPVTYSAVATFLPEGVRNSSGAAGIAAQFGLSVPTSDGLNSPQFYPDLIRSPQFLGAIAAAEYELPEGKRSLLDIYEVGPGEERVRKALGAEMLFRNVVATVAPRTGVVTVTATGDSPQLARDILANILLEVTRFNQSTRQGRAAAERRFIEQRLAEVRDSLQKAQDQLLRFLTENRDFTAPPLAFRRARLEQSVLSQQQLVATLAPSYEQSKIEEVRDTPVITVLRRPEIPIRADPRGRLNLLLAGVFGGLVLGVLLALLSEGWAQLQTSRDPAAREFLAIAAEITERLRNRDFVSAVFSSKRQ